MIKAVFFDIDGTLKDKTHIPDSAQEAIRLLQEQDILPVLCTGRSEYEVKPIREQLGIDWAITCNGAHIGRRGQTVSGTPFSREVIADWVEKARNGHTFLLYGADKMFITRPDCPYFRQAAKEISFLQPLPVPDSPDDLPPIYQVIVFCKKADEPTYLAAHTDDFYLHRWRTWALDINPPGTNKAAGVQQVLDHFGWTRDEAAAFGDGKNDIEMIRHVGLGIAMGNACDELLACTTYHTRRLNEGGIWYGVNTFILRHT